MNNKAEITIEHNPVRAIATVTPRQSSNSYAFVEIQLFIEGIHLQTTKGWRVIDTGKDGSRLKLDAPGYPIKNGEWRKSVFFATDLYKKIAKAVIGWCHNHGIDGS